MLKLGIRARGHFVTLIKIHVHLIRINPGPHLEQIYQLVGESQFFFGASLPVKPAPKFLPKPTHH